MSSLPQRVTNHVQLTTDALGPYYQAVAAAFGADVDYVQLHKSYQSNGERRYSSPDIVAVFHLKVTVEPIGDYLLRLSAVTEAFEGKSLTDDEIRQAISEHGRVDRVIKEARASAYTEAAD